tara:strand:- start:73 stop:348 length:276 start_codon:yes stop_codon:yes gene_type:complete
MKYTNPEHTMVEVDEVRGYVTDLIRLNYLKESDVIEPYVEPLPSAADKISELEAKVTPRRAREAMLTGDYSFIQGVEDQIKALSVRKDDKA